MRKKLIDIKGVFYTVTCNDDNDDNDDTSKTLLNDLHLIKAAWSIGSKQLQHAAPSSFPSLLKPFLKIHEIFSNNFYVIYLL